MFKIFTPNPIPNENPVISESLDLPTVRRFNSAISTATTTIGLSIPSLDPLPRNLHIYFCKGQGGQNGNTKDGNQKEPYDTVGHAKVGSGLHDLLLAA